MHPLLRRQLSACGIDVSTGPASAEAWRALLASIDRSYGELPAEGNERAADVHETPAPADHDTSGPRGWGRRRADAVLRARAHHLKVVVEGLGDGLIVLNARGKAVLVNPAVSTLLGFSKEDLVGQDVAAVLERELVSVPTSQASLGEMLRHPERHDEVLRREDAQFRCRDGSVRPVAYTLSRVRDRGRLVGNVLVFRQAADADALKAEFLSTVSHELRTPLNGIIGMAEHLQDTELTPEQAECTASLALCAENLLSTLNDVLDFSSANAGRMPLDEVEFSPRDVIDEALAVLGGTARSKGLELCVHVDEDVPRNTIGDPAKFRQVLMNVLSNAVKFTDEGEVVLTVETVDRSSGLPAGASETDEADGEPVELRCEVRDTGIGIPLESLERIFEPFAQVDGSTTRRHGGTGLGLAISQKLVRLMGGELEVVSEEGVGSAFAFTIRCRRGHDRDARSRRITDALRDMGILLVDDNETNLRLLERQVSRWGMTTVTARDAAEAMEALQRTAAEGLAVGVAVVDMCMPDVDGIGVARRIRSDPRLASMPLVLLSSATLVGDQLRHAEATFDACLLKPVSEQVLSQCLVRVCKKRRLVGVTQGPAGAGPRNGDVVPADGSDRTLARILLVEDTPLHAMLAKRVLERAGHQVTACETGAEALRALRNTEFDMILMDCQMPVMNGYQATRRIRDAETTSGRHQVIIAFTASALSEDCRRCYDEGMDDYLAKPYKARDLLRIVEEWLPWAVASRARAAAAAPDV